MRDSGLAIIGLVLIGCLLFVYRDQFHWGSQSAVIPARAARTKPDSSLHHKTVTASRLKSEPSQHTPKSDPHVSTLDVTVAELPFPRALDTPVATLRTEVLAQFGDPDMNVSWSDEGKLYQEFIYREPRLTTVIIFQNDKTILSRTESAETYNR